MNKNKQKISFKTLQINHSFTGTKLTRYAELSPIMKFINKLIRLGNNLTNYFQPKRLMQ